MQRKKLYESDDYIPFKYNERDIAEMEADNEYDDDDEYDYIDLTEDEKNFLKYAEWIEHNDPCATPTVKRAFASLYFDFANSFADVCGKNTPFTVDEVYDFIMHHAESISAAKARRKEVKQISSSEITRNLNYITKGPFDRFMRAGRDTNVSDEDYDEWVYVGNVTTLVANNEFSYDFIDKLLDNVKLFNVEKYGKPNLVNGADTRIPPKLADGGNVVATVNEEKKYGFINNKYTGWQYLFKLR